MPQRDLEGERRSPGKVVIARWLPGLVALAVTLVVGAQMRETRCALITKASPDAMVSLQLAPSVSAASEILDAWRGSVDASRCPGIDARRNVLEVAKEQLDLDRVWVPAYDRVLMQLLGSAIGWAALTTLWHVSINFQTLAERMTLASLVSGGAFVALRNWIGVSLRSGAQASAVDRFKPYLPEVLAYLTVALVVAAVSSVLISANGRDWYAWYSTAALMTAPIAVMLVLDPGEIGLHSFYRDRIVRAYPGASNPMSDGDATKNRHTSRRDKDDVALADLPPRPLHLVCCAANDLSGDPIASLSRGARSATLSRHGVAMAGACASSPEGLGLGGAVTASAAAFNSNMGSVSMSVGPVVSFLMAALNLRLGLWVPNPRRATPAKQRTLPGVLFFREMFALTIADERSPEIHLSDGGHFDNLALYELVRRLCRYVIDAFWNHPLNLAWVNYFARWASAPTFRTWWPLLRPMYSAQFQRFLHERFPVLDEPTRRAGSIIGPCLELPDGLASEWWTERHAPPPRLRDAHNRAKVVCGYEATLGNGGGDKPFRLGLVLMSVDRGAAW